MSTEVRAPEVVQISTQIHGLAYDVPYGDGGHFPVAPMHAAFNDSTLRNDAMFQTGQRIAAASSALVGSIPLTSLAPPVIPSESQVVDIGQLTEKMIFPAKDSFNGCRMSDWVQLPGKPGSFVRLREVDNLGAGLVFFFPWANHRRMQNPDKYDIVMDFENHTVPGGPYVITLEPGDALVWCPAKYIWPACVLCGKFLFPCDAHRTSHKHLKTVNSWWPTLDSLQNLEVNRRSYLFGFVQKNLRGLNNR
jgi:hypothetical protein